MIDGLVRATLAAVEPAVRRVLAHHLPIGTGPSVDGSAVVGNRSIDEALKSYERKSIETALAASGQNITRAARRLGTSRQSLQKRMDRLGIARTQARRPS